MIKTPRLTRRLLTTLFAALIGLMSLASLTAIASNIGGARSSDESAKSLSEAIQSVSEEYDCFTFSRDGWSVDAPDPLISVADGGLGNNPSELKYWDEQPQRADINDSCGEITELGQSGIPLSGNSSVWLCRFTERPNAVCFVELFPVEFSTTVTDDKGCTQSFNSWGYQTLHDCTTPTAVDFERESLKAIYDEAKELRESGRICGLGSEKTWLEFDDLWIIWSDPNTPDGTEFGCDPLPYTCTLLNGHNGWCDWRESWCLEGAELGEPGWCSDNLVAAPTEAVPTPWPSNGTSPKRTWQFNECVNPSTSCDYIGVPLTADDPRLPQIYELLKLEIEAQVNSGNYNCSFNTVDGLYPQTFEEWLSPVLVNTEEPMFRCRPRAGGGGG